MSEDRRRWMLQLKQSVNFPFLHLFILFRLSVDWTIHPHWGGAYALLSFPIQTLIISGNIPTGTLRNNVVPCLWASFSPGEWPHKVNHHIILFLYFLCSHFLCFLRHLHSFLFPLLVCDIQVMVLL